MQPPIQQSQQILARAFAAHQTGDLAQAEFLYKLVLQADKKQFDALHMLGLIEGQRGNFAVGLTRLREALRVRPKSIDALINLGRMQGELGDYADAEATYEKALALDPRSALAHSNLTIVLRVRRRLDEALAHADAAIKIAPDYADAWNNRGNVLFDLERLDEALADYDKAAALQPNHGRAHLNRGNALSRLDRHGEALAAYDRAIAFRPFDAECHLGRGNALQQLARYSDALGAYDRALAIKSDYAQCHIGRGEALMRLKRHEDAFAAFDKACSIAPDLAYAEALRLTAKVHICDWDNFDKECGHLIAAVREGRARSVPFLFLAVSGSHDDQMRCARSYMADAVRSKPEPLWRGERYRHGRIRVAYLSSDFRNHPVALLTAGMFEAHDRSRFETVGVSIGPDSDDWMRNRLRGAFDRFLDVGSWSNAEIARIVRDAEIDIAIDLTGATQHGRHAVFAQRPAPIQISYLGYCGTMGADFYDYFLADRTVIRQEDFEFFDEKIVWLPDTFMVTDAARHIAEQTPTRAARCICPKTAWCSAVSTRSTNSPRPCSRYGHGCSRPSTAVCCG